MGLRVEFKTSLMLSPVVNGEMVEFSIPPEEELLPGWGHPFREPGHYIYPVGEPLPLVESCDGMTINRVVGLVKIKYYGVEMTPLGVETFGEYVIEEVFKEDSSCTG